jgi:flavin-dependent dehydrogenase
MDGRDVYDVAIIGGGLAGLCLAIQCAKENHSVILLEKEEYPFHKVCGEYISFESWNFLQEMGVQLEKMKLPVIKRLQLTDVSGNMYGFELPLGGFGISRFTLDSHLYQIATSKGADIRTKTKVETVSFSDHIFTFIGTNVHVQAKVAIASFGKRSNLDVKWKRPFTQQKPGPLNNYIGIKYHINYSNAGVEIALHNFHNGYCGLSKIEDDKSCLCYLTTAENLRNCRNSIVEMERTLLYKNPKLKEIFTSAEFLYSEPLAISQISFTKKRQVENHLLMLGDAAGMISPLCGNGMSMAMHSAKLAFKCVHRFLIKELSREQMEKEYTIIWQKEFSQRLLVGRIVQTFFGGNTSTKFFLKSMQSLPALSRWIINATHGKSF